ncbi:MAG TPA: hypothetical protein VKY26_07190, partial [Actinomycetota bacterium]|nr:hypothetical protein [Actinomycetota bacterium]
MAASPAVDPRLAAAGRLIGLMEGPDDAVTWNRRWVGDPLASLSQVPTRLNELAALIAALLGPAEAGGPEVFPGAGWFPIPEPAAATTTPFYLVAPATKGPAGELGLGYLQREAFAAMAVTACVYQPV